MQSIEQYSHWHALAHSSYVNNDDPVHAVVEYGGQPVLLADVGGEDRSSAILTVDMEPTTPIHVIVHKLAEWAWLPRSNEVVARRWRNRSRGTRPEHP
jgi:hypothetical protein